MHRFFLLALASCSTPLGQLVDIQETHPSAAPIPPATECTVTTARQPAASANHVTQCSQLDLVHYPPSSGEHYPVWADFQTYTAPVPWGFLLHSMEHGAVVLAYNCPGGCPDILAAYNRMVQMEGVDPLCREESGGTIDSRMIIVPDPDLDTPIVAVSWEHLYWATCLDEPSLQAFVTANYGHGRENICYAGEPNPSCP